MLSDGLHHLDIARVGNVGYVARGPGALQYHQSGGVVPAGIPTVSRGHTHTTVQGGPVVVGHAPAVAVAQAPAVAVHQPAVTVSKVPSNLRVFHVTQRSQSPAVLTPRVI